MVPVEFTDFAEVALEKKDTATDPIKLFFNWYDEARTGGSGTHSKRRLLALGIGIIRRLLELILPCQAS